MLSYWIWFDGFPIIRKGSLFLITTALQSAQGLRAVIRGLLSHCDGLKIDKVMIGTEARGFILRRPLRMELNAGFVPVRKPNKLPFSRIGFDYDLEYGTDRLEIQPMRLRRVRMFGLSMICSRLAERRTL